MCARVQLLPRSRHRNPTDVKTQCTYIHRVAGFSAVRGSRRVSRPTSKSHQRHTSGNGSGRWHRHLVVWENSPRENSTQVRPRVTPLLTSHHPRLLIHKCLSLLYGKRRLPCFSVPPSSPSAVPSTLRVVLKLYVDDVWDASYMWTMHGMQAPSPHCSPFAPLSPGGVVCSIMYTGVCSERHPSFPSPLP